MIPKPWASSTYRRASCSRARAAKAGRSGGLPVIELMPSMQSSRGPLSGPWSSRRVLDVAGAEAPDGDAARGGDGGGVLDGPVGAPVDQDRPLAGEGREDAVVGVGQGREGEDVLDPEQLAHHRLDPTVGLG